MHFYSSRTCSHQVAGTCSSALLFAFLKVKHMQAQMELVCDFKSQKKQQLWISFINSGCMHDYISSL